MRVETEQPVAARSCQQVAVSGIERFIVSGDVRGFVDGCLRGILSLVVNPESLVFRLDEQAVAVVGQYATYGALKGRTGGGQFGKGVLLQPVKFVLDYRIDFVLYLIQALHHVLYRVESYFPRLGIKRKVSGKRLEINQVLFLLDAPYVLVLQFLVTEQRGDGRVDQLAVFVSFEVAELAADVDTVVRCDMQGTDSPVFVGGIGLPCLSVVAYQAVAVGNIDNAFTVLSDVPVLTHHFLVREVLDERDGSCQSGSCGK